MPDVKIEFSSFSAPARGVLVVFCDDALRLGPATRKALGEGADLVARAAAADRFKGKLGGTARHRGPGRPAGFPAGGGRVRQAGRTQTQGFRAAGRNCGGKSALGGGTAATIFAELPGGAMKPDQAAEIALGAELRGYTFDRYKTKKKDDEAKPAAIKLTHRRRQRGRRAQGLGQPRRPRRRRHHRARSRQRAGQRALSGRIRPPRDGLRKLGVAVEVLDVAAMTKLGMGALLGVGQGSERDSRLVGDALERRQARRQAGGIRRQGRVLRHRRHFDQAGGRAWRT